KASLSMFVTPNIKSIVVIIIINLWVLHDQFYIFEQMMWKLGYE
ncbi:type III secretion system apparatus protein VscT2, partial [Vibrio parahaemolyticus]|nr:type III secretion system apparatus protein VscT2 [Vibrio parahaemolyticus]